MRAGGRGGGGEESPVRASGIVSFERRSVRVVVECDDEEAEGEEVAGRGEIVVDGEVGGGEVEGVLDVGREAWVEGGRGRGGDGRDCEGEGGELPVRLWGYVSIGARRGGGVLMRRRRGGRGELV